MKIQKIFYINLDSSKDRKDLITFQYYNTKTKGSELPPLQRVSAIYPKKEDVSTGGKYSHLIEKYSDIFQKLYGTDTPHSLATLGCYLSHKKIYELISQEKPGYYISLEDDITLKPNWYINLQKKLLEVDFDFDIIRQQWHSGFDKFQKCKKMNIYSKWAKPWNCNEISGGTHFTVINSESAKKVLKHFNEEYIYDMDKVLNTTNLEVFHRKFTGINASFPETSTFKSTIKRPWDENK